MLNRISEASEKLLRFATGNIGNYVFSQIFFNESEVELPAQIAVPSPSPLLQEIKKDVIDEVVEASQNLKIEHQVEVKPTSKEQLAEWLKILDSKPEGRLAYQVIGEVVGGTPFFVSGSTKKALHGRMQAQAYMMNFERCILAVRESMDDFLQESKEYLSVNFPEPITLVNRVLAKVFFDMDKDRLPDNMDVAIGQLVRVLEGHRFSPGEILNIKTDFSKFSSQFLEMQLPIIKKSLLTDKTPSGNLTADVIRELMGNQVRIVDDGKIREYFNHPDVKSLPWIFLAGTNVTIVIKQVMADLSDYFPRAVLQKISLMVLDQLEKNEYKNYSIRENIEERVSKFLDSLPESKGSDYNRRDVEVKLYIKIIGEMLPFFVSGHDLTEAIKRCRAHLLSSGHFNFTAKTKSGEILLDQVRGEMADRVNLSGEVTGSDLKNTEILDRYMESCLKISEGIGKIVRFTQFDVMLGATKIKANTHVEINLRESFTEKEAVEGKTSFRDKPFQFFSAGERVCPGARMAEYILKIMIVELINRWDDSRLQVLSLDQEKSFDKPSASL